MKLTPFFLLAATPIIAAPGLDQRVSKLEQQMKEARMETVYGNAGARTVSATPATDRYGPSFSVDFLCWKPFIGGTEFAFTDYSYPNDGITFYDTALANVNFDWKFGFRTGFGYQFSDPDWDMSAVYTRVEFDQVVHRPAHPGGSVDASGLPSSWTPYPPRWQDQLCQGFLVDIVQRFRHWIWPAPISCAPACPFIPASASGQPGSTSKTKRSFPKLQFWIPPIP